MLLFGWICCLFDVKDFCFGESRLVCVGLVLRGVLGVVICREFVLFDSGLFLSSEVLLVFVKGRVFLEFVLFCLFFRFLESVLLIFLMFVILLWFLFFLLVVCVCKLVVVFIVFVVIVDLFMLGVDGVFGLFL